MLRRHAAGALAAVTLLACSDGTAPDQSHVGTYTLVTINGQAPPQVVSTNASGGRAEVLGARIVIEANGTYTKSTDARATQADGSATSGTLTESGSVSREGDRVLLKPSGAVSAGPAYTFTGGNTLTHPTPVATYTYRK